MFVTVELEIQSPVAPVDAATVNSQDLFSPDQRGLLWSRERRMMEFVD